MIFLGIKVSPLSMVCLLLGGFLTPTTCDSNVNPYPDEISFCIADIKFDGTSVKICEFGDGILSGFRGYDVFGQDGSLFLQLWAFLREFNRPLWFACKNEPFYDTTKNYRAKEDPRVMIVDDLWSIQAIDDFKQVLKNPYGIISARICPSDPFYNIFIQNFKAKYPEMIILGHVTTKTVCNKYLTNLLFACDRLAIYKPKSCICQRAYSPTLAQEIINALGGDIMVIKPVSSARGLGVIIVEKKDLDETLRIMIKDQQELLSFGDDPSYGYWHTTKDSHFIVEQYMPSKTVYMNEKPYDPTMRVVFSLYNKSGNVGVKFFDAYWQFPKKSLDQEGTLTEKHKSQVFPKRPVRPDEGYSTLVDLADFEKVKSLLVKPLSEVYCKMLEQHFGAVKPVA